MPLIRADARLVPLADESVNCVVTSPPYWGLRDYGVGGQLGLEATPEEYVANMVAVFREVRRVLRKDGTCWLNLGDSYNAYNANRGPARGANKNSHEIMPSAPRGLSTAGLKPKDLVGIPWRVAFALQADGWWIRQDIIWSKPNPMPESVTDRPTKAHEYIFLLTKSARYWYDADAVREDWTSGRDDMRAKGVCTGRGYLNQGGLASNHTVNDGDGAGPRAAGGRNARSVWTIPTQPFPGAHFATFPEAIPERCIMAGCPKDGVVFDPFVGTGTTVAVARRLGRYGIGMDLSWAYLHDHAIARGDGRTTAASVASLPMFSGLTLDPSPATVSSIKQAPDPEATGTR